MNKRTIGLLGAALLVLILGILSCSISQVLATRLSPTAVPTRTPRPTWTRLRDVFATPTVDASRSGAAPSGALAPVVPQTVQTPQMIIPGQPQPFVVPQGAPGQVLTVVVVIVTATPPPAVAASGQAAGFPAGTGQPGAVAAAPQAARTPVPGPPAPLPTPTNTPPAPVVVHVNIPQAFVRQGPGTNYAPLTQLDQGTTVTVVGRNRAGDWWKICCVNNSDVWIADSVVKVDGPLWTVPEAVNIPPSPMPTPTAPPSPTVGPTPTFAWPFHVEGTPTQYPLNQNIFRVDAVIYDGATPLWGYQLRIRKLSTGQQWMAGPSEAYWKYEPVEWAKDLTEEPVSVKRNIKWDSNSVTVPMDDDVWEVTATDGAGNPVSAPVRFNTSVNNSKWYYVVFSSRK